MIAEEFILVPKTTYFKDRPITEQILDNPLVKQKAQQISFLQRLGSEKLVEAEEPVVLSEKDRVFAQLKTLNLPQTKRAEVIYDAIREHDRLGIDGTGYLTLDGKQLKLAASTFLYNLQQNRKKLDHAYYKDLLRLLNIPEHFVANTNAKEIIRQERPTITSKRRKTEEDSSPKKWTSF